MQYTYWGMELAFLHGFVAASEAVQKDTVERRQFIYDQIRERSGLDFADFGDDIMRWIRWLEADDTHDYTETMNRYRSEWNQKTKEEKERLLQVFKL